MADVGQEAHQARHPEGEIGERHPWLLRVGLRNLGLRNLGLRCLGPGGSSFGEAGLRLHRCRLLQHRNQQPEDRVLRVALGQRLVDDLGIEAEHRHARVIDGRRERRADDLQLVQPDQLLARPLGKPGPRQRHGFERPAEALAALERRLGHAAHAPVVARKEADNQVRLMHRPGTQNHRFRGEHRHEAIISLPARFVVITEMEGVRFM